MQAIGLENQSTLTAYVMYFIKCFIQAIVSANLSTSDIDSAVTMLMNILYDAAMPR